jgi:hypothetical protein
MDNALRQFFSVSKDVVLKREAQEKRSRRAGKNERAEETPINPGSVRYYLAAASAAEGLPTSGLLEEIVACSLLNAKCQAASPFARGCVCFLVPVVEIGQFINAYGMIL